MNVNFSSASTLLAVDFAPVIEPILEVLDAILWPAIAIVGAVVAVLLLFALGAAQLSARWEQSTVSYSVLSSQRAMSRTAGRKRKKT